jgi:dihydropteroate synthase
MEWEIEFNPLVVAATTAAPRRYTIRTDSPVRGRLEHTGTVAELGRIHPGLARTARRFDRRHGTVFGDVGTPAVMGILNVTPDSFWDGGRYFDRRAAVAAGRRMAEAGAAVVDVGGESTRPGAEDVDEREERRRVVPVVRMLARCGIRVSVDTRKASVAKAALEAGARIVNDVSALTHDPRMAQVVARSGAHVVLMHMRGTPRTMRSLACYTDVVRDVARELRLALRRALRAGIPRGKIVLDPGIGFAKTAGQSLELIRRLSELRSLGCPILVGPSRKSFIGETLERPVERRLAGTAAAVAVSVLQGAAVLRVHDVEEMHDVVRLSARLCR